VSAPKDLIAAYRAAVYEIDVDGNALVFHVDEPNPALDDLLRKHGAASGLFITAYNPRSRVQPEEKNAVAHGALISAVREAGRKYVLARGRDAGDDGPTEAGLFVFDLAREDGIALARRFDQYAIVFVEKGKPPALVLAQ
jgi:hypothetical protein